MEVILHNILISFPTFVLILIIAATLFTLSKGADILVDEAVSLSIHWGIPKLVIGATIVSLGTTLPEATVSVIAAINGNPDLALGNAIGSIIVDTGLIIGLAALIGRLPADQMTITRQGKVQFFSGILLALVSLPFFTKGPTGNISQWMGWIFLILLVLYIVQSIKWAKKPMNPLKEITIESSLGLELDITLKEEKKPVYIQLLKLFIGVALVILSSKILIPSVEITAVRIGIPQSVIAATLVAFGTSLPELVTAITAVKKGHGELAVGNIVGADILNILFVIGSAAAVTKDGLNVPVNFYYLQIPTMLIILFAFRMFTIRKKDEITKKEGIILSSIYFVYLVLNYI